LGPRDGLGEPPPEGDGLPDGDGLLDGESDGDGEPQSSSWHESVGDGASDVGGADVVGASLVGSCDGDFVVRVGDGARVVAGGGV
jgi:hypothetical protein